MKRAIYSAFVLHDNGSWEQPSFSVPDRTAEDEIERALLARYGGFYIAGLQLDPDAPAEHVEELI